SLISVASARASAASAGGPAAGAGAGAGAVFVIAAVLPGVRAVYRRAVLRARAVYGGWTTAGARRPGVPGRPPSGRCGARAGGACRGHIPGQAPPPHAASPTLPPTDPPPELRRSTGPARWGTPVPGRCPPRAGTPARRRRWSPAWPRSRGYGGGCRARPSGSCTPWVQSWPAPYGSGIPAVHRLQVHALTG